MNTYRIDFAWKFDWDELRSQGVDELTGHIIVTAKGDWFTTKKISVKLTEDNQEITKQVQARGYLDTASYEYSLIPHYAPIPEKPDYDKMFAPSDQNDTILVVDGKKLHVNKTVSKFVKCLKG